MRTEAAVGLGGRRTLLASGPRVRYRVESRTARGCYSYKVFSSSCRQRVLKGEEGKGRFIGAHSLSWASGEEQESVGLLYNMAVVSQGCMWAEATVGGGRGVLF